MKLLYFCIHVFFSLCEFDDIVYDKESAYDSIDINLSLPNGNLMNPRLCFTVFMLRDKN